MAVHVPMFSHYNPKTVLIIDMYYTGLIHEILRHSSSLDKIDIIVESPEMKESFYKHYPFFRDKHYPLTHEYYSGIEAFDKENINRRYDVIIVGFHDIRFNKMSYFGSFLNRHLNINGVISFQYHNEWEMKFEHSKDFKILQEIFPRVNYYTFCVPTAPLGQYGFLLLSNTRKSIDFFLILCLEKYYLYPRRIDRNIGNLLTFYTKAVHVTAFTIPKFVKDILKIVLFLYIYHIY